jgi:hypothetical protein
MRRSLAAALGLWVISWDVVGLLLGVAAAFQDTGHISALGTLFIVVVLASAFGLASGIVFVPLWRRQSARLRGNVARFTAVAVLGAVAGLLGGYVADLIAGVAYALVGGMVAGAISGTLWLWVEDRASEHAGVVSAER